MVMKKNKLHKIRILLGKISLPLVYTGVLFLASTRISFLQHHNSLLGIGLLLIIAGIAGYFYSCTPQE